MNEQKPSICRMVVYRFADTSTVAPAVIKTVHDDGTVDLFVFDRSGFEDKFIRQGDGPGEWNFPPRV